MFYRKESIVSKYTDASNHVPVPTIAGLAVLKVKHKAHSWIPKKSGSSEIKMEPSPPILNETIAENVADEDAATPTDEGPVWRAREGFINSIIKSQKWSESRLNSTWSRLRAEQIGLFNKKVIKCMVLSVDD